MSTPSLTYLALAVLVAYLLGGLPFAYGVARTRGVDIFNVGSGQAGATNVWRIVGPYYGSVVFFADVAKGALSILFAGWVGITGNWLLLPALAAVLGHWNSPFTGFKGGDGVANSLGIAAVLAPVAVAIPMLIVALGLSGLRVTQWTRHPTLWAGLAGYGSFLALSQSGLTNVNPGIVAGITALYAAILVHSVVYHHRRASPGAPMEPEPERDESGELVGDR